MPCWSAEQVSVFSQTPSALSAALPSAAAGWSRLALLFGGEALPAPRWWTGGHPGGW